MTRAELKAKAASRYAGALKQVLLGENPFPLLVPYKRPLRSGDPTALIRLKEFLRQESKAQNGFGPTVTFESASTRKFGTGTLAGDIFFESLDDLTRYIGKKAEADRMIACAATITTAFPAARAWIAARARWLAEYDSAGWEGIVRCARHFIANPKPWVYPREISLGMHTKFLEEHHAVLIDLLEHLSPATLNKPYANWQDRLGLRSSSDMIEGRLLDDRLAAHLPRHMIAPVAEWNRCASNPSWVLIVENRTTLLTLRPLRGCVALLGKGYAVRRLAQLDWLGSRPVYYWGDIDQHGFEILASLQSVLPYVQSCLMDEATLDHCREFCGRENVNGTLPAEFVTANLQPAERAMWQRCASAHLRLEQENIPTNVSLAALQHLVALSGS
jgi:hypothetical protein